MEHTVFFECVPHKSGLQLAQCRYTMLLRLCFFTTCRHSFPICMHEGLFMHIIYMTEHCYTYYDDFLSLQTH